MPLTAPSMPVRSTPSLRKRANARDRAAHEPRRARRRGSTRWRARLAKPPSRSTTGSVPSSAQAVPVDRDADDDADDRDRERDVEGRTRCRTTTRSRARTPRAPARASASRNVELGVAERQVDDPADDRQPREHEQRDEHRSTATRAARRVVHLGPAVGVGVSAACRVVAPALVAVEDQPHLAGHVERGEQRGDEPDRPEP